MLFAVAGQGAEQAMAAGKGPDPGPRLGAQPGRDERLHPPVTAGDPQRCVSGAAQSPHLVHDQLEDAVEVQLTGNGGQRGVEGGDAGLGPLSAALPVEHLAGGHGP